MEEEPAELQCEENTAHSEKNKRKFKTPSQLQALEDFYTVHKYPTETLKAELAEKIGLSEKQISSWFCHRRLKDKRIINGEINPPGKQDLSSGVIQDRGSGLKQDSCSSTKQGDYKLADVREVESQRFHNGLAVAEINYEQKALYDGTEMDDTSSESDSALPENYYPHNRSRTTDYRTPNGFVEPNRRCMGPSGYLKIKGQTENVAITAVKRQLGRQYREDGPPLGIEFDPLPPGAFESPSKNANTDAYGDPEAFGSSSLDVGIIHKRPGLNTTLNRDMYLAPKDYRSLHKSDPDSFAYRQPKQKSPFPNDSRAFPAQKSPLCSDPYSAKEISDYDGSVNHSIVRKHDLSGKGSDFYGGKFNSEPEEPAWHNFDNGNSMAIRRRERFDARGIAPSVRNKDSFNKEDRFLSNRIVKDEEIYADKTISEHHDFSRKKMRMPNEFRVGKKGREEFLQEYPIRPSSQEQHQWSRPIRRSTELPSSFSEDETAETSSSME